MSHHRSPRSLEIAPTLDVVERFESLQGEGVSLGQPCTFLRLADCNLSCRWCDTPYSWDYSRYDRAREAQRVPIAELAAQLNDCPRLVVTGGEPLIQQKSLVFLFARLRNELPIEIETNGTITPLAALLERVDQWNVSPKLAAAGDPEAQRIRLGALRALLDTQRAFLKLVVSDADEIAEVEALLERCGWPRARVLLMPEAADAETHARLAPKIAALCLEHGFRFSPRLHVQLWGGKRGT